MKELIKIENIRPVGNQKVYDISVGEAGHYLLKNGVVSHNSGMIYASSIVVAIKKLKLKVDSQGNKTSQVHGIRAACKVMKSRFAKPFESVQIAIPYETGMDPYSGLVDYFEQTGLLTKTGNKLEYVSPVTGEVFKEFRKHWEGNADGCLDMIMNEYDEHRDNNENDTSAIADINSAEDDTSPEQ